MGRASSVGLVAWCRVAGSETCGGSVLHPIQLIRYIVGTFLGVLTRTGRNKLPGTCTHALRCPPLATWQPVSLELFPPTNCFALAVLLAAAATIVTIILSDEAGPQCFYTCISIDNSLTRN